MDDIAANLTTVRARIAAACVAAGRDPSEVRLLPVSKTRPAAAVRTAYAAGCRRFGENRPQDLAAKAAELADLPGLGWVMIGHLQRNKAALIAAHATEFHGLDSLDVARDLERRLERLGRPLDVLIQVNTSGETTKSGLAPDAVLRFAADLQGLDALRVRGLMTIAANTPDRARVAACFALLADLQSQLRSRGIDGQRYDELSMGMSGDYELAIAHGATVVRIGTAIFGARG
ncbi:MAG: YggS family pyridoxal phosphate-dependent enzyme [Propionibacteriaceae bacterium]|nr:YggS family pyridoxal phosphate-dependent enzyme [Propionibacteriaceae bacterium]